MNKKYIILPILLLMFMFCNIAGASYLSHPIEENSNSISEWRVNPCFNISFEEEFDDIDMFGKLYTLNVWLDSPVLVTSSDWMGYSLYHHVFSGLVYNKFLDGNGDGYVSTPEDTPFPYVYDYNGDGSLNFIDISYWTSHIEYDYSIYYANHSVNASMLPWDNCNYTVNYTIKYYTNGTTFLSGGEWFWFGDYDDSIDYYFAFGNWDPHHLDFYGANALRKVSFSCISNDRTDRTLHLVLTNNDRKNIAYGQRDVYFDMDTSGCRWQTYEINPKCFNLYNPYYEYFGLTNTFYNWGNTAITLDDTCYYTNFSVDDPTVKNNDVTEDHTQDKDYIGGGLWFETNPDSDDDLTGWTPEVTNREGSLGDMIDEWANDPAVWGGTPPMPWFKYVVSVIIIVVCTCIPFGFALRTDIELPTFIYGVAVTIGVFVSFGLELIDLWIMVFYILILVLSIILTYREPLEDAYERLTPYGSKLREDAEGIKGAVERYGRVGSFKTFGERSRSLREKRKLITSMNITHVKNKDNKRIPRATRASTGKVFKNYSDSYAKKMKKAGYRMKDDYWAKED